MREVNFDILQGGIIFVQEWLHEVSALRGWSHQHEHVSNQVVGCGLENLRTRREPPS